MISASAPKRHPDAPMAALVRLVSQCLQHFDRFAFDCAQQRLGGTGRLSPSLFPVAQRAYFNLDDLRESGLRQSGCQANPADTQGIDVDFACGRAFTASDLAHLRHAFNQFGKQLLVH